MNHQHRKGFLYGSVVSPLFSNIYLHEFDCFMERLIESNSTEINRQLKTNPTIRSLKHQLKGLRGTSDSRRADYLLRRLHLSQKLRHFESLYTSKRSLHYVRYADDWIIGLGNSRTQAESLKSHVSTYLRNELHLELSDEKTKVTNLLYDKALFLGTEITRQTKTKSPSKSNSKRKSTPYTTLMANSFQRMNSRLCSPKLLLHVPIQAQLNSLLSQGFGLTLDRPLPKREWQSLSPHQILSRYQSIQRGIMNYYSHVDNKSKMRPLVRLLKRSALLTLVKTCQDPSLLPYYRTMVNQYLGVSLRQTTPPTYTLLSSLRKPYDPNQVRRYNTVLHTTHIFDMPCNICGTKDKVEVHHEKDLNRPQRT